MKTGSTEILSPPDNGSASLEVSIIRPERGSLYINNQEILPLPFITLVVGSITVEVNTSDVFVQKMEFYCDFTLRHTDYYPPFNWTWGSAEGLRHILTVTAYDNTGNTSEATFPVWIFKNLESNAAPMPRLSTPAGNGIIFDPSWETTIVTGPNVSIRAFETSDADDVVSTVFEYSAEGANWTAIETDVFGGFEGTVIEGDDNTKFGDEGWSAIWNTSSLAEGYYFLRATMTDERGQTGSDTEQVYLSLAPPVPTITQPLYGETIQGVVEILADTTAVDVTAMTVSLYEGESGLRQGNGWYNQTGLGHTTSKDNTCMPVAAANALAGLNNSKIFPPGHPGDINALMKVLARKFKWDPITGSNNMRKTGGHHQEVQTDNIGSSVSDYLKERGIGCDNSSGYTVTVYGIKMEKNQNEKYVPVAGSNTVTWEHYDSEIRKDEAVFFSCNSWGSNNVVGQGHTLTGLGSNAVANADGTQNISFIDPANGQELVTTLGTTNGFSTVIYPPGSGQKRIIIGMWAVSPKQRPLTPIGMDTNPHDGWMVTWDTSTVPNGFYTLMVDMMAANGFIGRDVVVVEVYNSHPDSP